jgi:hypothetical protein
MRKSLGEGAFETAYEAGHALALEEAVAEAHAWLEKNAPAAPSVVVEFRRRPPSVVGG